LIIEKSIIVFFNKKKFLDYEYFRYIVFIIAGLDKLIQIYLNMIGFGFGTTGFKNISFFSLDSLFANLIFLLFMSCQYVTLIPVVFKISNLQKI